MSEREQQVKYGRVRRWLDNFRQDSEEMLVMQDEDGDLYWYIGMDLAFDGWVIMPSEFAGDVRWDEQALIVELGDNRD